MRSAALFEADAERLAPDHVFLMALFIMERRNTRADIQRCHLLEIQEER
jgi:hypothetical protein